MAEQKMNCPECDNFDEAVDRRGFLRTATGTAVTLVGLQALPSAAPRLRADEPARAARPAESLIRELHAGLSEEQKRQVVLPWNHGAANGTPTRLRMYNAAIFNNRRIEDVYTPAQRELCQRILKGICSGDDGFRLIINCNKHGGQVVYHLHMHLVGGAMLGPMLTGGKHG